MKKKKKSEKQKMQIPPHRWEGIDDDAEQEGSSSFSGESSETGDRNETESQAANFNPFDEEKFEGNLS